jgi:hypothetical protein
MLFCECEMSSGIGMAADVGLLDLFSLLRRVF